MKILITGGAGYIGFNLAKALCRLTEVTQVSLHDNFSRHNGSIFFDPVVGANKIELITADILDTRKLRKAMAGKDLVVHLAARVTTPFANQDPHFFEQVNHWGTAEVVYAAEDLQINRLIYLSSTAVYGRTTGMVDESTAAQPQTYYGISKRRGEDHVQRLTEKGRAHIIRCGNVYGYSPALRFDAVINHFMMQANTEKRLSIHGTGMQVRSFVHIHEVVEMLSQLSVKEVPSGVYNFVTKSLRINEIADAIEDLYPGLERIYINQHIGMSSLEVSPETALHQYLTLTGTTLKEELRNFRDHFTFGHSIQ